MTRGQWGCVAAPVGGVVTGVLGTVVLSAAWQACDVGVNGAANGLALIFYGALLTMVAAAWWGAAVGYIGRWNIPVALLGSTGGAAIMVWIFVALLHVPDGYRC